jgi:hypothetical protein
MTAEVAILNKEAVALASDSIVTITSGGGRKTYPASNKLFTLSKHHPVGVLAYGSTEVHTVPIEIAIKEFRARLRATQYEKLEMYSSKFLEFLGSFLPTGPSENAGNFRHVVDSHVSLIRSRFLDLCIEYDIPTDGGSLTGRKGAIFDSVLDEMEIDIKGTRPNPKMAGLTETDILSTYPGIISDVIKYRFDKIQVSRKISRVTDLIAKAILSDKPSRVSTGVVVAGYGSDEYYPSIFPCEIDGLICGKLKVTDRTSFSTMDENSACIYPFAQRSAADLFILGVDSAYQKFIEDGIDDILPGIAELAAKYFSVTNRSKINRFKKKLQKKAISFKNEMGKERRKSSRDPILDAVKLLEKSELAVLAESLVSITAMKQKISLDLETVGGAIDVALISKHDGFIWIKRKHYFDAKFNPLFSHRYLTDYPTSTKGVP